MKVTLLVEVVECNSAARTNTIHLLALSSTPPNSFSDKLAQDAMIAYTLRVVNALCIK